MRSLGAPEHIIKATLDARTRAGDDGLVGLWPEHFEPVKALFACGTQWRRVGTFAGAHATGFDYVACDIAMARSGITLDADGWRDFQALETHACALLNGTKPGELRP